MRLIVTRHAHERMSYHGISEEQVKLAIQRGANAPQTDGLIARYTYICVAYKICGENYVIKTVFVQR